VVSDPYHRAPLQSAPFDGARLSTLLDPSRDINPDFRRLLDRRRTPSAAFRLFFHVVFSTRFRFQALQSGVDRRFIEVLREVAGEQDFRVLPASVNEEHVHLLLSLQPKHSVADIVKAVKGRTSRVPRQEFPRLQHEANLWTSGYYVDSLGEKNVPQMLAYLQRQREGLGQRNAD
jgi:putative transposase